MRAADLRLERDEVAGAALDLAANDLAALFPTLAFMWTLGGLVRRKIDMADVRAMCAIGRRGQLGLKGRMPWEGDRGPEFVADVARFFRVTRGHVIMAGPVTAASIPSFAREDRTVLEIRSHMKPKEMLAQFADRVVFIGGGPPVWDAYGTYIRHWDITVLPYDGDADRWFDPIWLVGGAHVDQRRER